jgi:hypothetical protein
LRHPFAPFREKKSEGWRKTKAYVDSTGAGRSVPGKAMPDTNPACRTAFRCNSEIVRHPIGTLSGITPECCPPSARNRVRHGAERAPIQIQTTETPKQ